MSVAFQVHYVHTYLTNNRKVPKNQGVGFIYLNLCVPVSATYARTRILRLLAVQLSPHSNLHKAGFEDVAILLH